MGQRPITNPFLAPTGPAANPFQVATTMPHPSPFGMPAPAAPSSAIGVVLDEMALSPDDATYDDAAPSRQDLLQRAAELGPARMTWESIVLHPSDPILGAKMQPRVAERRARFRKLVKVALGACVAFCMVATVASAVSASTTNSTAKTSASGSVKTAPATGIVTRETLDSTPRPKASSKAARSTPAPKFAKRVRRH